MRAFLQSLSIPDRAPRVGSLFGVPLRVSTAVPTFLMAGILVGGSAAQFAAWMPKGSPPAAHFGLGVLGYLILLASLLAHEFAHVLTSRRFGTGCADVTLTGFGMVARLESEPGGPAEEAAVTAAGPGLSVALALAGWGLARTLPEGSLPCLAAWFLCYVNVAIAAFNMVPCYPMDGGRLVRSAAWAMTGNLTRATRVASLVGWTGAALLVAHGALLIAHGNPMGAMTVAIAVAMLGHAARETRERREADALLAKTAGEIMRPFGMGEEPAGSGLSFVPLLSGGRPASGIALWRGTERVALLDPKDVGAVAPDARLPQIMEAFAAAEGRAWPVLIVSDGTPLGYLTQGQVKGLLDRPAA